MNDLQNVTEQITFLYHDLCANKILAKKGKLEYNSLVLRKNKMLDKEAFIQREYSQFLYSQGIEFAEQVKVPNGRIDILTKTFIIEIKYGYTAEKIYQAIGQLEYYSLFFPDRKKKIVLNSSASLAMQKIAQKMNIEIEIFEGELL
jgi:hypothetical protein